VVPDGTAVLQLTVSFYCFLCHFGVFARPLRRVVPLRNIGLYASFPAGFSYVFWVIIELQAFLLLLLDGQELSDCRLGRG